MQVLPITAGPLNREDIAVQVIGQSAFLIIRGRTPYAAGEQFVIRRSELIHVIVCIGFVRRCGRAPTHSADVPVQTRHGPYYGTLLIAGHVSYFSLELFAKKDAENK